MRTDDPPAAGPAESRNRRGRFGRPRGSCAIDLSGYFGFRDFRDFRHFRDFRDTERDAGIAVRLSQPDTAVRPAGSWGTKLLSPGRRNPNLNAFR
ncbi:hypothetical protein IMZ11_38375 [Microtetraspora sp. AC03309]|uniref:hypothetical protein n=1 Tax=Microtetraspora sp. AC03309 TaxID=2779376 RepID=UPI001E3157AF|nr:hypothetical protein [Microtetraspora sp. AC03309]MCC5581487.1 hypothetical protein [Microtetraspora sp. AC03309]